MKYSCLHTHTVFCDGNDDIETMCRAAAEKGLAAIGFSSHAPVRAIREDKGWHMAEERLGQYIDEVNAAKKRWRGKLDVYLGLEVDYIEGVCGPSGKDIQQLPLDYIIGAVHYVISPKNGGLFTVDCSEEAFETGFRELFDNDGAVLYGLYYNAYRAMVQAGGFDIAGHFDLVKKNNGRFRLFSPGDPAYQNAVLRAADSLAASSVIVEVNTGGMNRGRISEPYPSEALIRLLHERKLRFTITADAHSAGHLGGHYEEAVKAMLNAGCTSVMFFTGKSWIEESLR